MTGMGLYFLCHRETILDDVSFHLSGQVRVRYLLLDETVRLSAVGNDHGDAGSL